MSAARIERLLNLLTLLLNTRRPISLREIREHEEFAAYYTRDPKSGERAFERDKAALVELGVPLRWIPPEQEDDEDGLGGYMIDREHYYLPDIQLAPEDLALLSIAGSAAATIDGFPGRNAVIRALAKLGFDVDEATTSSTLAHAPIQEYRSGNKIGTHLQILHDAVAKRFTVTLMYSDAQNQTTNRDVNPYGLYYRQGIWYLVGYCHLREAERTFHLGRVRNVKFLRPDSRHADFEVPESFSLSAHVQRRPWEFPKDPPCTVMIRLNPKLAPAIGEIFGPRTKTKNQVSGPLVQLTVHHRAALISTVLPYGADAEVLEPEDLRTELLNQYRQLSHQYQSNTNNHPVKEK